MRLLLDTQVALFALADPEKLTAQAHDLIADDRNAIFVSVVSLWEISLKYAGGPARAGAMPIGAERAADLFQRAGYDILDLTGRHVLYAEGLGPGHPDPLDRLIVAQALSEPMRLLTHDPRVAAYSDAIIKV